MIDPRRLEQIVLGAEVHPCVTGSRIDRHRAPQSLMRVLGVKLRQPFLKYRRILNRNRTPYIRSRVPPE